MNSHPWHETIEARRLMSGDRARIAGSWWTVTRAARVPHPDGAPVLGVMEVTTAEDPAAPFHVRPEAWVVVDRTPS